MSKMVTRCPQCQTSFRVTDEHLKIANGAVRCGSCLNVFQAKDHWVPEAPATPTTTEKQSSRFTSPIPTPSFLQAADKLAAKPRTTENTTTTPVVTPPASQAPAAGKFQFDQATIDAAPKGKFQFDQSSIDSSSASSFLAEPDKRIPETILTKAHSQSVTKTEHHDSTFDSTDLDNALEQETESTEATLSDFGNADDDYSSLFDDTDITDTESDDFESLLAGSLDDLDSFDAPPESTPVAEAADDGDELWAKELLAELEDDDVLGAAMSSDTRNEKGIHPDFSNPTDVDAARRDLGLDDSVAFDMSRFVPISAQSPGLAGYTSTQEDEEKNTGTTSTPPGQMRQNATSREELIAHIGPAPVEISPVANSKPPAWKAAMAEIGICVILVLGLAGQHLFFQFDYLAKQESTRPMVAFVCNVTGCTLPPSEVWRNIRVSNLVVRKHDAVEDALVVDAIISNHASYELPFPKLELYFNDLEQLPVASRRFEPQEYLAGELAGKTRMPAGRPIHIAFEIVNPGDEAVNWRLDVAPFQ